MALTATEDSLAESPAQPSNARRKQTRFLILVKFRFSQVTFKNSDFIRISVPVHGNSFATNPGIGQCTEFQKPFPVPPTDSTGAFRAASGTFAPVIFRETARKSYRFRVGAGQKTKRETKAETPKRCPRKIRFRTGCAAAAPHSLLRTIVAGATRCPPPLLSGYPPVPFRSPPPAHTVMLLSASFASRSGHESDRHENRSGKRAT